MRKIELLNPDGSRNQLQVFGEEHKDRPIIVILPAMGVKSTYYHSIAKILSQDYIAMTMDLRGHGESSIRPSMKDDFGYKEMIDLDIKTMVERLMIQYSKNKLYLMGHSLGGQMACLFASKYEGLIDGVILVGCCSVYYKGWQGMGKFKTLFGTQLIGVISRSLGYYPGKTFGFGGTEAKTVMIDWSNQSRTGKYVLSNDPFDYETALSKLKINTLAISFEADDMAPEKAVENLYLKFNPTSGIKHIHMKNDHPLNENYDHYSWTKRPVGVVKLIKEWIG
ncbi:MAG: alpha/beta fold hydrolase [Chitinophagales bacterium]